MQELISNIQITVEVYRSIGKIILLLTTVLGLFLVKANQRIRVIGLYVVLVSLIVLNPFLITKEGQLLGEDKIYRLGMLFIIPILSAYAIITFYKTLTDSKKKIIAMVGILILLAVSGKFVYTKEYFFQLDNEDKVYDLAVNIADCVTKEKETPTVAISKVQGVFLRQYNANIKLVCAPKVTENWQEPEDENILNMRAMLADPVPDMSTLTETANQLECDYLILLENQVKVDSPENYGFTYVATFEKFQVFENHIGVE